jgi:SAD/SRA domain-containing protein
VTSRQTRNLVRVLRSASSGGQNHKWLPRGGLRYDGLYQVVGQEIRKNKNDGAFYQFKLVRRDTWPIDRYVPNQQQLAQLAAIKSAYI